MYLFERPATKFGLPVASRDHRKVTVPNVDAMTWVAKPRLFELFEAKIEMVELQLYLIRALIQNFI